MADSVAPKPDVVFYRRVIIRAMQSPLGFFVFALLIVEGLIAFFLSLLFRSSGDIRLKVAVLGLGVGLFVFMVLVVRQLVMKFPRHLTFSEDAHLEAMHIVGDSDRGTTALQDRAIDDAHALPAGSDAGNDGDDK